MFWGRVPRERCPAPEAGQLVLGRVLVAAEARLAAEDGQDLIGQQLRLIQLGENEGVKGSGVSRGGEADVQGGQLEDSPRPACVAHT